MVCFCFIHRTMAHVSFVLLQLTQKLTIEVRNVHEPPVSITMSPCQPGLYPVNSPSVNESSVAGSCVALVQAIDNEPNQLLGFTLDDDSNGLFSLSFSTTNCTLLVRHGFAVLRPMHYLTETQQLPIFSQCACVFHRRMDVACVHTRTRPHSPWLKLKVLVTKGVLGSARGLTSSDALICCQVLVLILMADETDPARGLIRSWWRIRSWWLWWSSSVTKYLRWACLAVSPHHHNNPTFCSYCCWICFSLANGILHWVCFTCCTEC